MSACCSPSREPASREPASREPASHGSAATVAVSSASAGGAVMEPPPARRYIAPSESELLALDGGTFVMGEAGALAYVADGEEPVEATIGAFSIGPTSVTNDQFAAFVAASGYVTDAERYDWSFVFGGLLPDHFPETRGVVGADWWRQVFGATWRTPEGPGSTIDGRDGRDGRDDHPVVHVSCNDALAYAGWSGTRLPSEGEWEFAARGGTQTTWPWGMELEPGGRHRMNVFQGTFPSVNSGDDGWEATCPVRSFEPNDYGLWNMVGNVWEWTADAFTPPQRHVRARSDLPVLMKGGSFLCHDSYCRRYRAAARMGSAADSSASNVGFRIAR